MYPLGKKVFLRMGKPTGGVLSESIKILGCAFAQLLWKPCHGLVLM